MRYAVGSGRSLYYPSDRLPPAVKWLLIVNVGVFLLQFFVDLAGGDGIFRYLMLWPGLVLQNPLLTIVQLFTYMFLHSTRALLHIVFNMLALWMFGSDLERDWGTRAFLKFYFLCGVGAGICVIIANALTGGPGYPTIGASGAIYGVLLAFGLLYPDRIILFAFLFPIKAKYFVMIIGAIAFLGSLSASGGGISHVAHLGGMIFGYAYLRQGRLRRRFNLIDSLSRQYHAWKLGRAKRRFEVYMRKQESKHNRHVH